MDTARAIIKFIIGWPLSLLALFFIGKIIFPSLPYIWSHLYQVNLITLFISVLFFLVYFLIRCIFWQKLLSYKGHSFSLKETAFLWTTSEIKRYLPGNVWALIGRTMSFSKKEVAKKTTIAAFVLEAEFVTMATAFISLFSLPFILYSLVPKFSNKNVFFYGIIFISFFVIFLWILSGKILKKLVAAPLIRHLILPFPTIVNMKLLSIMSMSFLFFGLATYFSVISFFFIPPNQLFIIAGFFVFCLLVGYLSIITPMGLGVREGIMTIGLAQFIPITLAGFASIFARIMFTFSEVLFLTLAYLWEKNTSKLLKDVEMYIKNNWQKITLIILLISYCTYFTAASLMRYINFYTGRFDLGNMDQTVWNSIHGRIFQLTDPNGTTIVSRLAFHADFILVLLAPFYLFWQDPRTLLFIQTLILTFGGLFVYLIAKEIIKNKTLALVFAASFLINPSLNHSNLYDFHAVVLATTFLLGAWYFILKRKPVWYILFLILAGLTKEEVWMVVALLGIYLFFFQRAKKIGSIIFISSISIFWYVFFMAIPHAAGGSQFALSYVSDFGSSPGSIIKNIFLSPLKTLSIVIQKERLLYLFQLLLPVGFLSLFAPLQIIFLLPDLIINLLSTNGQLHQIYFQYTATLTPFLFISSIYGVYMIRKNFPKITYNHLTYYILITALLGAWLYGPLPGEQFPNVDMFFKPQPSREIIDDFLQDIPQQYSIAATNNLGSHLSHRQNIYTIPNGIDKADVIAFLLNDGYAQPSLDAQKRMAANMKNDQKYIEVFRQDDFIVFEKRNLYLLKEPNITKIKLFPFSIPALEKRDYVGGDVTINKRLAKEKAFTSYDVSYPSDGLTIHALMQIPNGEVPKNGFPVVIIDHGQINPIEYDLEKSYTVVSSYFADNGFLVIKPDYRNNGNSDKETDSRYVITYPIDVLNLFSSLHTIPQANTQKIFIWGHSVGGEVTLAAVEAHDQNSNFTSPITAVSLWSPIIDPYKGYVQLHNLYPNQKVPFSKLINDIGAPRTDPLLWASISPLYYLDDIKTPFIIRQGENDTIVPYQWSIELYNDVASMNLKTNLYLYPNEDHTFSSHTRDILREDVAYFKSFLDK